MRVAVLLQRRNIRNPVLGFALSELSSRELDDTRTRRFKIPPPTYDPHPSNRPEGYTSPYRKVSALEKSRGVRASVTADKALSIDRAKAPCQRANIRTWPDKSRFASLHRRRSRLKGDRAAIDAGTRSLLAPTPKPHTGLGAARELGERSVRADELSVATAARVCTARIPFSSFSSLIDRCDSDSAR